MNNISDIDGDNLVFIVGCPRSGTTWLQRLLAGHPKIRTGQESHIFDFHIGPQLRYWRECADPVHYRGGIGLATYFTEHDFLDLIKIFLSSLLQPMLNPLGMDEIFLEKTPDHGLFIPEIIELLPKSRFIHVLRDARDVIASLLAASKSWGSRWAPKNVKQAAWMWTSYVSAIREASKVLSPAQFLEIRYEELFSDSENTLKKCIDFLRLEWSTAAIKQAITDNTAEMLLKGGGTPIPLRGESAKSSNKAIVVEPEGFIRYARPKEWQIDLGLKEKYWVWKITRHLMTELGYFDNRHYSHQLLQLLSSGRIG